MSVTRAIGREPRRRRLFACALLVICAEALPRPSAAVAAPAAPTEDALQAAFLFNFAQFTRWTRLSETGPVKFCILEESLGKTFLAAFENKHIGTRPVTVQYFRQKALPLDCHIVYLGRMLPVAEICVLARDADTNGALTVSDAPGFDGCGGHVTFTIINERLRFIVNLAAVQQSGVVLSSELLNLAIIRGGR